MTDGIADLAALQSLTGSAYRWYGDADAVRADDQLVRSRACDALCRAVHGVREAEAGMRRAMPVPTRENPFPDPALSERLGVLRHVRDRIEALETRLRGAASLPDRDFSVAHGVAVGSREILVQRDAALIAAAEAVAAAPGEGVLAALEAAIDTRAMTMAGFHGHSYTKPPSG